MKIQGTEEAWTHIRFESKTQSQIYKNLATEVLRVLDMAEILAVAWVRKAVDVSLTYP